MEEFKNWVVSEHWRDVLKAENSNKKAEHYAEVFNAAVDRFFPMITTRRRSTDLPWINSSVRKKIRRRKAIYRDEGKSPRWRRLKKVITELIERRMENFHLHQKQYFFGEDAKRHFFRNVKSLSSPDRPKQFDVRTLHPDKTDGEVAEELASYFNAISTEFSPLEPADIPVTFDKRRPDLTLAEVSMRIRKFRKPRSSVGRDIFPQLLTQFSDFLAIPLTNIFNKITRSKVWPLSWKVEYVTVIPKKSIQLKLTIYVTYHAWYCLGIHPGFFSFQHDHGQPRDAV